MAQGKIPGNYPPDDEVQANDNRGFDSIPPELSKDSPDFDRPPLAPPVVRREGTSSKDVQSILDDLEAEKKAQETLPPLDSAAEHRQYIGQAIGEIHAIKTGINPEFTGHEPLRAKLDPKDFTAQVDSYQPKPKAITDEPIPVAAPAVLEDGQINNQIAAIVTPPEERADSAADERAVLMDEKNEKSLAEYQKNRTRLDTEASKRANEAIQVVDQRTNEHLRSQTPISASSWTGMPDDAKVRNPKEVARDSIAWVKGLRKAPAASPETAAATEVKDKEGKEGSRFDKLQGWLKQEGAKIDSQATRLGGSTFEKALRYAGENYNKLGWKSKLAVGAGLGLGIAAGTAGAVLSVPFSSLAAGAFGTALTAQRILGGLGMFNKFEKHLDKVHEGSREGYFANHSAYQWIAKQPEWMRSGAALLMAAGYAVVSREVIGGAAHFVGQHAGDWLSRHWPFGKTELTPQQEMDHMTWAQMHPGQPYPGDAAAAADAHKILDAAPPKAPVSSGSIPNYPRADFTEPTSNGPDLSASHAGTSAPVASGAVHPELNTDAPLAPDAIDTHISTPLNHDIGHHIPEAVPASAAPAHEAVPHAVHHIAHHPKGISLAERDVLETRALNELQKANPGVTATPEQITAKMNELLAEHVKHAEHIDMLNAARAKLHLPLHPKPELAPTQPDVTAHAEPSPQPVPAPAPSVPAAAPEVSHVTPAPAEAPVPAQDMTHAINDQPYHAESGTAPAPVLEAPHPAEVSSAAPDTTSASLHPVETVPAQDHAENTQSDAPAPSAEHLQPFTNHNGVPIDPSKPGQYTMLESFGRKTPYFGGGDSSREAFNLRYNMAMKFATDHPGTRVAFDATGPGLKDALGEPIKHLGAITVNTDGSLNADFIVRTSVLGNIVPPPDLEDVGSP